MTLIFLLTGFATAGGLLGYLAHRLHRRQAPDSLIERINAELPQLQCGDCGYPGCRPYAAAVAGAEAGIDLCPPGGAETVHRLAALLNTDVPTMATPPQTRIAYIDTDACVGCALCLPVCPTDAIIGTARHAHTVVNDNCVGCALCLPPCPVNCIEMRPVTKTS